MAEELGSPPLGSPTPAEPAGARRVYQRVSAPTSAGVGVPIPERSDVDPDTFQVETPDPDPDDESDIGPAMTERHRRPF